MSDEVSLSVFATCNDKWTVVALFHIFGWFHELHSTSRVTHKSILFNYMQNCSKEFSSHFSKWIFGS